MAAAKADYDADINKYDNQMSQRKAEVTAFANTVRSFAPEPDDVCSDVGGAIAKGAALLKDMTPAGAAGGRKVLLIATDLDGNCGEDAPSDLSGVEVDFIFLQCPSREVCEAREGFWLPRLSGANSVRFLDPEQSIIFLKDLFR